MTDHQIKAIEAKVNQIAADVGKPPWDSPLRTKRYVEEDNGERREMLDWEWGQFEWYDVTSIYDPADGHVYVRGRSL